MPSVLIVDDYAAVRSAIRVGLTRYSEFSVCGEAVDAWTQSRCNKTESRFHSLGLVNARDERDGHGFCPEAPDAERANRRV